MKVRKGQIWQHSYNGGTILILTDPYTEIGFRRANKEMEIVDCLRLPTGRELTLPVNIITEFGTRIL